jgi:hypothetical protein
MSEREIVLAGLVNDILEWTRYPHTKWAERARAAIAGVEIRPTPLAPDRLRRGWLGHVGEYLINLDERLARIGGR